ncbi:unnamed protein product [Rotaria sp. Silwood1]|nr:unnamed protein product [Rotaria sp. Silwood1]
MGRLLSGDTDPNSSDKSSEEGIGDALADYCSLLSIDESQIDIFSRCDSITKACRTIVSHLYSKEERIGMAWKNVPVKKQNAILDMARLLNPLERGKSDGELIKACRNVFEAANCCKRKLEQVDIVREIDELSSELYIAINIFIVKMSRFVQYRKKRSMSTKVAFGMELASMMKSLNEGSDDNISRSASTDLIPDVDMTSASNNQNQNMTSIPAVPEGSILDDAIRQIENSSNNSGRRVEAIDISAALLILKARHRLSNRCLSDILKLLRILRVANVPTSLWKSRKLVNTQSNSHLHMKKQSICPSCKDTSSEVNRCTKCHITYQTILTTSSISIFYRFDIGSQLESILLHTPDLVFQNFLSPPSKRMRDIVDGVFYRNQLKQETDLFITLTMNVDGVQPNKGSDSSIWPVLIVVNEIRRRKRYSLENVILAGVWPGPKKPSRDDMAIFLKGIVNELKCLEAGRETVETEGGGHVTSFIINADETINPRSNDQYNELLETMKLNNEELASLTTDRDIKAAKLRHTESQMGLKGPCCLRELKYFDFGQSFVVDSLHNIYLGAFKKVILSRLKIAYNGKIFYMGGSSDLNEKVYSYDDLGPAEIDLNMTHFNLDIDRMYVIPLLKQILVINPYIKLLGSPWSPPLWMKNNQASIGGSLLPQYYDAYALYFVRYVQTMEKEGITIDAITIQNEPLSGTNNPSMVMHAEQQAQFIKQSLGPAFRRNSIKTKILVFDHNPNRIDYPLYVLQDRETAQYVDGSAFHMYRGIIEALSLVHDMHPDKNIYFTERGTNVPANLKTDLVWHVKTLIVGATRSWARTVLEWNLAADPQCKPHTPGGCTNCLGALTIDKNQVLSPRNPSYYIIAHAAKFIRPNSVRIGSNLIPSLPNVAFQRHDDERQVLVVVNENDRGSIAFKIRCNGHVYETSLNGGSVGTYIW